MKPIKIKRSFSMMRAALNVLVTLEEKNGRPVLRIHIKAAIDKLLRGE